MTSSDLTDITIVLDRSGSMASVADDTVGGFNTFIEEQKKQPGQAVLSLVQFDDRYEPNYTATPISQVPSLEFQPRGMTALLDAIGKTIVTTGERLAAMPEDQRPGKVLFVISTDGFENHSREYSPTLGGYERIRKMIEEQTSRWNWQFIFLGANQDAVTTGAQMGFTAGQSLTTTATRAGTRAVYDTLGQTVNSYRSAPADDAVAVAAAASFSDEDRWKNDPSNPENKDNE